MTIQTLITNRGRQILAARVPGDPPLASIILAVGDGNGQFPVPNVSQVGLVNERWRAAGQASVNGDKLGFVVTIPAGTGGFAIREVGVFVGPAGAEELAVVSQFDGRFKPPAGENGASALTIVVAIDYSGSVVGAFTITLDENLQSVDPNVHRVVTGRVTAPPENPVAGSTYAIAAVATGEFAGRAGQIARRRGTSWVFETPIDGHKVFVDGAGWFSRAGADYVAYAFPVAAHAHDDRYYTQAQIATLLAGKSDTGHGHDDRYVRLASVSLARQSVGPLTLSAGDTNAAPVGGTLSGVFVHNGDMAYGLRIGVVAGDGRAWLQAGRVDGSATYYNINLNPLGGNIGIGVTHPADKLEVAGNVKAVRAKAEAVDYLGAGGVTNWTTYQDANTFILHSYAGGGSRFAITKEGAIGLSGDVGVTGRVIATQGGGQPAAWANVIDLLSTAQLRAKIGGKTIIALGSIASASATVTFSSPEPNALYSAVGFGMWSGSGEGTGGMSATVGLSAKTVNGCTVTLSGSISGAAEFIYIIYRD